MEPVERVIRRSGLFLRRRDLLRLGYTDGQLRYALEQRRIFRVRHGWYSIPSARDDAVAAVRIGGRLTGISALESYGLRVPRRAYIDVVVPANACRLRRPDDRRRRLGGTGAVRIHWADDPRETHTSAWRVSEDDALLRVLETETRDIAVACASAIMRYRRWSWPRLARVFRRAPARVSCWQPLVGVLDDSHGETFVRLWVMDAGLPWESQPFVEGAGRLDGRVSPNTYIEVDGGQHDPEWTGDGDSTWEPDHDRDTTVGITGGTVLRYTYRQLYTDWARCLAVITRSRNDDLELLARRARDPVLPRSLRASRKRRSSAAKPARLGLSPPFRA